MQIFERAFVGYLIFWVDYFLHLFKLIKRAEIKIGRKKKKKKKKTKELLCWRDSKKGLQEVLCWRKIKSNNKWKKKQMLQPQKS